MDQTIRDCVAETEAGGGATVGTTLDVGMGYPADTF
jgi:hypothetical protein